MDADLIKNLLKGQGGSPIAALLPMLLGGNAPDHSSLLGGIVGTKSSTGDTYPPLFGESTSNRPLDMMGLLKGFLPATPPPQKESAPQPEYPYELQYNHPYMHDMHKN
ncbi:MAG: hypothetical protein IJT69_05250 [Clostridia bacterium]|nr:hypothetical protein [Clostridia bacterium]